MNNRPGRCGFSIPLGIVSVTLWIVGCSSPIGVKQVSTREAYEQVEGNALSTGKPSAETASILERYQLGKMAVESPDEALRRLHAKAVDTGERDMLFALAELSYAAGDCYSGSSLRPDHKIGRAEVHQRSESSAPPVLDPRDYYLGAAVYAWLFLFGDGSSPAPDAFDRRFRTACDLYNYGLGLALVDVDKDQSAVRLVAAQRRLPVGKIDLKIDDTKLPAPIATLKDVMLTDRYRVRGLRVSNRRPGVGAPLICVSPPNPNFSERPCLPVTALLRCPMTLAELDSGHADCVLELHPFLGETSVEIGNSRVPLEADLATAIAYGLNDSKLWNLGSMQFRKPGKNVKSQLLLVRPYDPERIPVVFVHGTFSSPLTWVEMSNTLAADPILRRRYQLWSFIYGSGNPLVFSMGDLRAALLAKVQELDPNGNNPRLREMVLIGHSQGGLLVKSVAVDTGDRLWRAFSAKSFDDPSISDSQRAELQRLLFLKPLPFVRRVVFIATPHRGAYPSGGFVRRLAQWLVSLSANIIKEGSEMLKLTEGTETEAFFEGKVPTSLDGMSPKNPALLALAEIPVAKSITAHSIIAVEEDSDPAEREDGLVTYKSAHVDYAQSEFIVTSFHSCLNNPATIDEVRRILHLHLDELSDGDVVSSGQPQPSSETP